MGQHPKCKTFRPPRASASGTMLLHNFYGRGPLGRIHKKLKQEHCAEAKKGGHLKIHLHFWPFGPNQHKKKF